MAHPISLEVLEGRIAPAILFVNPTSGGVDSLSVQDSTGAHVNDAAAQSAAGSTVAVHLAAGDQLVFDANHDLKLDKGDTVLVSVAAGSAEVFLTDGVGATAGAFDLNEITGLAISDAFSGKVGADINGPVVTALDSTGAFTGSNGLLAVQHSSLAQLSVAGEIAGSVLTGASLHHLTVGSSPLAQGSAKLSVGGSLDTGTATANQTVIFNQGAQTSVAFTTTFAVNVGENGGDITDVLLSEGFAGATTGQGGDGGWATIDGGHGGSIIGLTVKNSAVTFSLQAGGGGNTTSDMGNGGSGGSIGQIKAPSLHSPAGNQLLFQSGAGGSSTAGAGGAGGSLQQLQIMLPDSVSRVSVIAGNGGVGDTMGGAGGSITDVSVHAADAGGSFIVQAGAGGNAVLTLNQAFALSSHSLAASTTGEGGMGGNLANLSLVATASTSNLLSVHIAGGAGGGGYSAGGDGGGVSHVNGVFHGQINGFGLTGGAGGDGATIGGAGGSLARLGISVEKVESGLAIEGGSGGASYGTVGGKGGSISHLEFHNHGSISVPIGPFASLASLEILGGSGGFVLGGHTGTAQGGAGGDLSQVKAVIDGALQGLLISSGTGGSFQTGTGSGGNGGNADRVTLVNHSTTGGTTQICTGAGGGPEDTSSTGNGGDSGRLSRVYVTSTTANSNAFEIFAGTPSQNLVGGNKNSSGREAMVGVGAGATDGSIGDVWNVHVTGRTSTFVVGSDEAAAGGNTTGGATAHGGNGGNISFVTSIAGLLDIVAPSGGDSQGTPGNGGSIHGVYSLVHGNSVHLIAAGDGGASDSGGTAGKGGSLSFMDIVGDIGNFKEAFGFQDDAHQGGLVVGQGSTNGDIHFVVAHRIATIMAGRPDADAISYANAVAKISRLSADVIGANTGIQGDHQERGTNGQMFDFNGGTDAKFEPDSSGDPTDGDTAVDGVVILAPHAGPLPVAPLLLVQERAVG